ncbi:hypothetical protein HQ520_03550 [bacterium]|nr:hypothetical protein [bacterium]
MTHTETYWYFRFDPVRDVGAVQNAARKGYRWAVESYGPWHDPHPPGKCSRYVLTGTKPLVIYDPTNGSVSPGHISRTNKGIYTGQDCEPWEVLE